MAKRDKQFVKTARKPNMARIVQWTMSMSVSLEVVSLSSGRPKSVVVVFSSLEKLTVLVVFVGTTGLQVVMSLDGLVLVLNDG